MREIHKLVIKLAPLMVVLKQMGLEELEQAEGVMMGGDGDGDGDGDGEKRGGVYGERRGDGDSGGDMDAIVGVRWSAGGQRGRSGERQTSEMKLEFETDGLVTRQRRMRENTMGIWPPVGVDNVNKVSLCETMWKQGVVAILIFNV